MERKLSKIYTSCHHHRAFSSFLWLIIINFIVLLPARAEPDATTESVIRSSSENPAFAVDGDSLEIGTSRIRLMGIDAPEYDQSCKNAAGKLYPCGQQSADFLAQLIKNRNIVCHIHKKDKYDRDLCTCYAGNTDINAEMIRSGHAIVYLESAYDSLQRAAQAQKIGIWNGIFMHPRLFRLLKYQQKKALKTN